MFDRGMRMSKAIREFIFMAVRTSIRIGCCTIDRGLNTCRKNIVSAILGTGNMCLRFISSFFISHNTMKKAFFLQISLCTVGYFSAVSSIVQAEAKSLPADAIADNKTSSVVRPTKSIADSLLFLAQVTTDGTVNTKVNQQGNVTEITGGETKDGNLFHSFQDFSVGTGDEAFFNNGDRISNIFSRITGGNVSSIDGLIRANGDAHLFFINPAGIVFGENAKLDIGGSFIGSTANSILFADGTSFSANDTQANPVLTVSVPVGLQLGPNSGEIEVLGNGNNLSVPNPVFSPITFGQRTGLRVQPNQTLALVAGGIILDGGTIAAPGGQIELGSVADGLVTLNSTDSSLSFGYESITNLDKIEFRSQALADVSGTASIPSGSIQVRGQQLTLNNGSLLLGQNVAEKTAGDINLDLSESIVVSGTNRDSTIRSSITNETLGIGNGGNIKISTDLLRADGGGTIVAKTLSPVKAASGNLEIKASSIEVVGASSLDSRVTSAIVTGSFGSGDSGDNNITTDSLTASRGGTIASSAFDTGNSGDINITANSIQLIGTEPNVFAPSAITASTLGTGDAGDLTINTSTLSLQQGGRVDASTVASGNAGSVTITATDSIVIGGTVPNSFNPSLIIASANIIDPALKGLFGLDDSLTGDSGNVTITTSELEINRGGQLTVRNDGTGDAGILSVTADKISLSDGGGITAATQVGKVGNIDLSANNVFLQDNSTVSAQTMGQEDGGNITLNTDNLVLLGSSKLTADANEGRGGNIQIDTQGLFVCEECQVTASSQLGVDGVVEINTLQPNSQLELFDLSRQPNQLQESVVVACPARSPGNISKLTVKGRGGLPPRPQETLGTRSIIPFNSSNARTRSHKSDRHNSLLPSPARSWYTNERGAIVLSARPSSNTVNNSPQTSFDCRKK